MTRRDWEHTHPIYYYATGSGNDLWHDLGRQKGDAPCRVEELLKNLPVVTVKGESRRVINGVGYGIDGYCCEVGDQMRAASAQKINYTSIAIQGLLFHYHPTKAVVTVDGVAHTFKKAWLAPTMNGRFYGGGMMRYAGPGPPESGRNGIGHGYARHREAADPDDLPEHLFRHACEAYQSRGGVFRTRNHRAV